MFIKLGKTSWAIIFAFLSMFVLGLSDNMRGPLYPELIKFFSLSNAQASYSFAITSMAAVLANTLAAFALRKIQLDRLLAISIGLMFVAPLIMGTAPNYIIFLSGALILGLSFGSMGVAQNLLIAENTYGRQQTQALAGLHGIYGFSSLIAPWLASRSPTWFSEEFVFNGWRSAYFVTTILSFLALVVILVSSPKPQFEGHVEHDEAIHGKKSSFVTLLWFAGFFASYVGAEILISSRLALYMRTYFNMTLEGSSNYVTYFFIFMLVGRLFFAFKSFQMKLKNQLNISLILSIVSLVLGLWVHPLFLAVVGLTMGPFYPLGIVYISEITGVQKRRFLTFAMGMQGLFVIFMHLGVGYISDALGLFSAFGLGIILLLGSILCLNLHPKISAS